MNDHAPDGQPPKVNLIRIRENGPLEVHADLRIAGGAAGFRAKLCRCGASKNKPYCDGSHVDSGFVASGEVAVVKSAPLATRDGPLNISPIMNGLLRVEGAVEIVTGTGKTVNRTRKTFLCRCGHSGNKPYCDGSHHTARFVAAGIMD